MKIIVLVFVIAVLALIVGLAWMRRAKRKKIMDELLPLSPFAKMAPVDTGVEAHIGEFLIGQMGQDFEELAPRGHRDVVLEGLFDRNRPPGP